MTTNAEYLLDTTILVAALRGDPAVRSRLEQGYEFFLSIVTLAELLVGAYRSAAAQVNKTHVLALCEASRMLPCDTGTAEVYAQIIAELTARGTQIPNNDVWIAATAQQNNLTLVTRDQHFLGVPGLNILTW
jgi:tRNA(fMet)-specific endonuclease VapC